MVLWNYIVKDALHAGGQQWLPTMIFWRMLICYTRRWKLLNVLEALGENGTKTLNNHSKHQKSRTYPPSTKPSGTSSLASVSEPLDTPDWWTYYEQNSWLRMIASKSWQNGHWSAFKWAVKIFWQCFRSINKQLINWLVCSVFVTVWSSKLSFQENVHVNV